MSTIAAIGTALGNSGINIIRISGKDALSIISKVFNNYNNLEPNKIIYGKIYDNNVFVDNVLVSYFKSPNSFTGEDICEINCHGGTYVTRQILDLVLKNGCEIATPGEFSKRAFLNGKMDLSEAEGVIDLINSKTRVESKIASSTINGILFNKINELREKLIELLAHIEVSIDYPEYDYEEVSNSSVKEIFNYEIDKITELLNSYEEGKYIKNGINVALLGKPNVGKSSLFNLLAKYDRAIVTDIAGTTRDVIEESINIGDVILNIFDTAGIRDTDDVIEKIGVDKSIEKIEQVDLIIYILNVSKTISVEDKNMLSKIKNKGIKCVVVINKMDKVQKAVFDTFMKELDDNDVKNTINISVKDNIGIEELKSKILELFFRDDLNSINETIIVNERHRSLLQQSLQEIINAKQEVDIGMSIDIISIKLKKSAAKLGEIIGKDISVDVVSKIFEKFCLGK